jgi:hypothetical protein
MEDAETRVRLVSGRAKEKGNRRRRRRRDGPRPMSHRRIELVFGPNLREYEMGRIATFSPSAQAPFSFSSSWKPDTWIPPVSEI